MKCQVCNEREVQKPWFNCCNECQALGATYLYGGLTEAEMADPKLLETNTKNWIASLTEKQKKEIIDDYFNH